MSDKISINDLTKLRKIIFLIIDILENNINDFSNNVEVERNTKLITFLIGDSENVVSILTKLINSLVKVIPLEEKVSSVSDDKIEKLSDEDVEILKRYIDKCNFVFNKHS
ncbi:MAG TPA: hypothetical protein VLL98_05120 [Rickettsiales bacterium]|nr:hypothetical protein [Rickettsiales bacterium]